MFTLRSISRFFFGGFLWGFFLRPRGLSYPHLLPNGIFHEHFNRRSVFSEKAPLPPLSLEPCFSLNEVRSQWSLLLLSPPPPPPHAHLKSPLRCRSSLPLSPSLSPFHYLPFWGASFPFKMKDPPPLLLQRVETFLTPQRTPPL